MSLLAILGLASVPVCFYPMMPGTTLSGIGLVVLMTANSAMIVIGATLFSVIVPGGIRGLCMGMLAGVCVLFGIGIAPPATSLLTGLLGGPSMIDESLSFVCVGTTIVCVAASLLGRRYLATNQLR
jgi:hypothetical protein